MTNPIDSEPIAERILVVRGQKVLLSSDLARLYGVEPRSLIQAVKRNQDRFPVDFMFQLTHEESLASRSQFVILNRGRNLKYAPYAFTEQGVAMLSSVLRSPRAVQVNIAIMRAFVKLRATYSLQRELARKVIELELRVSSHDENIQAIFQTIKKMTAEPEQPKKRVGFKSNEGGQ